MRLLKKIIPLLSLLLLVSAAEAQNPGECQRLHDRVHQIPQVGEAFQELYDSTTYFIQHCPDFNGVWQDFQLATTGCLYRSLENSRFAGYREWLKKVLYANLDSLYYCADVKAILTTFQYFNNNRGNDRNGELAVYKFLHDSNRCSALIPDRWQDIRDEQHDAWIDTVGDPTGKSIDTTLPSLEQLDLQILRGSQYAAVKNAFTPSTQKKILYLKASENPFTDETMLQFGLSDKEYVKIEVYDVLGNMVYSDGGLFTEGDGSLRIEGKGIPRGQLYARLSSMGGEVMTIKLVKE
jgi:hypothetical protein